MSQWLQMGVLACKKFSQINRVGAAEGCDLLIHSGRGHAKDQKIAAFGSSYRGVAGLGSSLLPRRSTIIDQDRPSQVFIGGIQSGIVLANLLHHRLQIHSPNCPTAGNEA